MIEVRIPFTSEMEESYAAYPRIGASTAYNVGIKTWRAWCMDYFGYVADGLIHEDDHGNEVLLFKIKTARKAILFKLRWA